MAVQDGRVPFLLFLIATSQAFQHADSGMPHAPPQIGAGSEGYGSVSVGDLSLLGIDRGRMDYAFFGCPKIDPEGLYANACAAEEDFKSGTMRSSPLYNETQANAVIALFQQHGGEDSLVEEGANSLVEEGVGSKFIVAVLQAQLMAMYAVVFSLVGAMVAAYIAILIIIIILLIDYMAKNNANKAQQKAVNALKKMMPKTSTYFNFWNRMRKLGNQANERQTLYSEQMYEWLVDTTDTEEETAGWLTSEEETRMEYLKQVARKHRLKTLKLEQKVLVASKKQKNMFRNINVYGEHAKQQLDMDVKKHLKHVSKTLALLRKRQRWTVREAGSAGQTVVNAYQAWDRQYQTWIAFDSFQLNDKMDNEYEDYKTSMLNNWDTARMARGKYEQLKKELAIANKELSQFSGVSFKMIDELAKKLSKGSEAGIMKQDVEALQQFRANKMRPIKDAMGKFKKKTDAFWAQGFLTGQETMDLMKDANAEKWAATKQFIEQMSQTAGSSIGEFQMDVVEDTKGVEDFMKHAKEKLKKWPELVNALKEGVADIEPSMAKRLTSEKKNLETALIDSRKQSEEQSASTLSILERDAKRSIERSQDAATHLHEIGVEVETNNKAEADEFRSEEKADLSEFLVEKPAHEVLLKDDKASWQRQEAMMTDTLNRVKSGVERMRLTQGGVSSGKYEVNVKNIADKGERDMKQLWDKERDEDAVNTVMQFADKTGQDSKVEVENIVKVDDGVRELMDSIKTDDKLVSTGNVKVSTAVDAEGATIKEYRSDSKTIGHEILADTEDFGSSLVNADGYLHNAIRNKASKVITKSLAKIQKGANKLGDEIGKIEEQATIGLQNTDPHLATLSKIRTKKIDENLEDAYTIAEDSQKTKAVYEHEVTHIQEMGASDGGKIKELGDRVETDSKTMKDWAIAEMEKLRNDVQEGLSAPKYDDQASKTVHASLRSLGRVMYDISKMKPDISKIDPALLGTKELDSASLTLEATRDAGIALTQEMSRVIAHVRAVISTSDHLTEEERAKLLGELDAETKGITADELSAIATNEQAVKHFEEGSQSAIEKASALLGMQRTGETNKEHAVADELTAAEKKATQDAEIEGETITRTEDEAVGHADKVRMVVEALSDLLSNEGKDLMHSASVEQDNIIHGYGASGEDVDELMKQTHALLHSVPGLFDGAKEVGAVAETSLKGVEGNAAHLAGDTSTLLKDIDRTAEETLDANEKAAKGWSSAHDGMAKMRENADDEYVRGKKGVGELIHLLDIEDQEAINGTTRDMAGMVNNLADVVGIIPDIQKMFIDQQAQDSSMKQFREVTSGEIKSAKARLDGALNKVKDAEMKEENQAEYNLKQQKMLIAAATQQQLPGIGPNDVPSSSSLHEVIQPIEKDIALGTKDVQGKVKEEASETTGSFGEIVTDTSGSHDDVQNDLVSEQKMVQEVVAVERQNAVKGLAGEYDTSKSLSHTVWDLSGKVHGMDTELEAIRMRVENTARTSAEEDKVRAEKQRAQIAAVESAMGYYENAGSLVEEEDSELDDVAKTLEAEDEDDQAAAATAASSTFKPTSLMEESAMDEIEATLRMEEEDEDDVKNRALRRAK